MALVDGLTKARMLAIEAASVVSGVVVGTNLHLTTHDGTVIDAGAVQGPPNSLSIGTVTTGAAGTAASASVTGVSPSQTLSLTIPKGFDGVLGGTAAQRDTYFGSPIVLTDQVALANKAPLWYNVTTGQLETYYVPSGSAGLTVPGFYATPGWYPRDISTKEPLGLQAIQELPSNTGSTTGILICQNVPSFTFKANRWYLIKWNAGAVYTSGSSAVLAQLFSCSTADSAGATTGLTELNGWNLDFRTVNQTIRIAAERRIKYTSDTTLQIKAAINGNGSTVYASGGPTWPQQLSIEDLGKQI